MSRQAETLPQVVRPDASFDLSAISRIARGERRRLNRLSEAQGFTGPALKRWRRRHVLIAVEFARDIANRQLCDLVMREAAIHRAMTGGDFLTPLERAEKDERYTRVFPIHDLGNDAMIANQREINAICERGRKRAYDAALKRLKDGTAYSNRQQIAAE